MTESHDHTAFYRRRADGVFVGTAATAGPWSASTQHCGPPSALLGRALEECAPREGFRLARVTLDLPGPQAPHTMSGAHLDGYIAAMEWRFPAGAGFDTPGPGQAWARQRIPLVEGEPDTPVTRALTLADASWAVAFELDHVHRLVINNDVTVALHRDPTGEWLGIRSDTAATPGGSGLSSGVLHDSDGECGRILQTLLIAQR